MSVTESKAVISVTADTKQAVAEINKLAAAEGKRTEGLKKQADSTGELGKKWEELSKSMVGLQLHDAFKRVSDGAKEATNGVVDLNLAFAGYKVAGPWGAAVGAVGVAAFKAAEQFSLMKGRLGELVEEVKVAADPGGRIPQLTAALYAQEAAVLRQNRAWEQLPGILALVNAGFGQTYKALGQARKDMAEYDAELQKKGRILALGFGQRVAGGMARRSGGGGFDPVATGLGGVVGEQLGGVGSYPYLDEMQRRADAASAARTSSMIRGSTDFGGYAGFQTQIDAFNQGEGARRTGEAYDAFNTGKTTSFMERTFGPVGQFDAYASAFQGFQSAVSAGYEALVTGSEPVGKAFKKMAAQSLLATGAQLMGEGIKNEVYALGYLITGNLAQAAAAQAAAAKAFAGAAVVGVLAAGLGAGGGSAGSTAAKAPNVSGGAGGGGGRNPERVIVYSDPFAESTARERQLQAEKLVSKVYGNSAVVNE